MAVWDKIANEVNAVGGENPHAAVRRRKIAAVQEITGRRLIVYAADFASQNPVKGQVIGALTSISLSDKDGFDDITRQLARGSQIDVLLHSPGGSAEATESIVDMLRSRFSNIRFIIPSVAKSAATMMAMSGNQLLMDERSEVGPTDPQFILNRDGQTIVAPAQAIRDQFKMAQDEVNADPSKLPSWIPVLREYGPSLLAQCDNLIALSRTLVTRWLSTYMFGGDPQAAEKADRIARYLADHNNFHSHARRVGMTELQGLGVNVLDMRTDARLHDAVRELYTAIMYGFFAFTDVKVWANSDEEMVLGVNITPLTAPAPAPSPAQLPRPPIVPRPPNRAERRHPRR